MFYINWQKQIYSDFPGIWSQWLCFPKHFYLYNLSIFATSLPGIEEGWGFRWANWGQERSSDSCKVSQQLEASMLICIHVWRDIWSAQPVLYHNCLSASLSMSLVLGVSSVLQHLLLLPSLTPSREPPHLIFIPRGSLPHETQPAQSEFSILPLPLPIVTKSELNSGPHPSQDCSGTAEAFSGSWISPAKNRSLAGNLICSTREPKLGKMPPAKSATKPCLCGPRLPGHLSQSAPLSLPPVSWVGPLQQSPVHIW